MTGRSRWLLGLLLAGALLLAPAAAAKQLRPGDVRVCGARRCAVVRNRAALDALGAFYYDTARPLHRVRAPRLGTPCYRLVFADGYVTGIVAGPGLDRFLSYGVNLDRFRRGAWYRVPRTARAELVRLARGLAPLRLTTAALRRAR